MRVGKHILALGVLVGVAACGGNKEESKNDLDRPGQTVVEGEAPTSESDDLMALFNKTPEITNASPFDIDFLASLLPDSVEFTYADKNFNESSGLTEIEDLKISFADLEGLVLTSDALRIWGGDSDFLIARIRGEELDETRPLAARVELENLKLDGGDALFASLETTANDALMEYAETLGDEDVSVQLESAIDVSRADMTIGRLVVNDFALEPFEWKPVEKNPFADDGESAEEGLAFVHAVQKLIAVSASYSFSSALMEDTSYSVAYSEPSSTVDMSAAMPRYIIEDYDRGDIAFAEFKGMTFTQSMTMADPTGEQQFDIPMDMSGQYGTSLSKDIKLAKAYRALSLAEMPDPSETDFMSLGHHIVRDARFELGGKPFYSMARAEYDLTGFEWLVPKDIRFQIDDLSYHLDEIATFFVDIAEQTSEIEPEMLADINLSVDGVVDVLKKYDLGAPKVDFALDWSWSPDAGDAVGVMTYGIDGISKTTFEIAGISPPYETLVPHIRAGINDEEADEDALEALFEEYAAFSGMKFKLVDEGGAEKLFNAAPEIAKVIGETMPDAPPALVAFGEYEPDTVRMMVSGAITMAASQVNNEFPRASEIAGQYAKVLTEGGEMVVEFSPVQPLKADDFEALEDDELTPMQILDRLGFSSDYTAP